MGKCIVELKDRETLYKASIKNGEPYVTIVLGKPYIEPDLEQIKKEAYAKAYADAVCNCSEGCSHVEQVMKEAYEQGMIDERERIINIILDGGTI